MAQHTPRYQISHKVSFQADKCVALEQGADAGQVRVEALARGRYQGKLLAPNDLPGVCSVGFWDAAREQDWGIDWQRNEGIELTLLEAGRAEFALDEQRTLLAPGQMTITRPWQRHQIGGPHLAASRLHWMVLDVGVRRPNQDWHWPPWLTMTESDRKELTNILRHSEQPVWRGDAEIRHCFQLIAQAVESDESGSNISRLTVRLNELFVLILDMFRSNPMPLNKSLSGSRQTVELFLDDLAENMATLEQPWTLRSMAKTCGLGVTKFVEECREITNLSPVQYLRACRIRAAGELLRTQPEKGVTEIAMSCGFSSSQYFATVFRRETGISPGEFREN